MILESVAIPVALWVFEKFATTAFEEGTKVVTKKTIDNFFYKEEIKNELESLAKGGNEKEFINLLENFLKSNEEIKNKLLEVQKKEKSITINQTNNGNGNIGQANNSHITNNTTNIYGNKNEDYEIYYQKGINAMKDKKYKKALKYFDNFIDETPEEKDAMLLKIACTMATYNRIGQMKINETKEYVEILNTDYKDTYLGLILLGILHIDFFQQKQRKVNGLTYNEILNKIK